MIFPLIFFIYVNNIKNVKTVKIIALLMVVSILFADRNFYNVIRYMDMSHYHNELKFGGVASALAGNALAVFLAQYTTVMVAFFEHLKGWKFKTFLADNFQVALSDRERGEGCILQQSLPFLGKGRILLTGEAAGMMYLNGEGISAALDSGYQAGLAIAQGLKKGMDVLNLYREKTEEIVNHVKLCVKKIHFFA